MRMISVIGLFIILLLSELTIADQGDDTRAPRPDALSYPGSTPEIVSIFDRVQLDQIQQCVCQLKTIIESSFDYVESQLDVVIDIDQTVLSKMCKINTQIDAIESVIENIGNQNCNELLSQIDQLLICSPIPITGPTTIAVPGSYCLSQNIVGDLIIASSDVAVDLNGHAVFGAIKINSAMQYISVSGGEIQSSGSDDGLVINQGCDDIRIFNLIINNAVIGLHAIGTGPAPITNIYLSDLVIEGCSSDGCHLTLARGVLLNSSCSNNGGSGIVVDNSLDVENFDFILKNVKTSENAQHGFYFLNSIIVCEACFAFLNQDANYDGFNIQGGACTASHCVSTNNLGNGFSLSGCEVYFMRCIAQENGHPAIMINGRDGFFIKDTSVTGIIHSCVANLNSRAGFDVYNSGSANNVNFIANYAADNPSSDTSTNYATQNGTGITIIGVKTNTSPYGWLYWNSSFATAWSNVNGNN